VLNHRLKRVRVLEALERRAKGFRTDEDLYPLRVPREPLPLSTAIEPDDRPNFDALSLRSRTLLALEWEDGSRWEAWVLVLPSGLKLFCDSGEEEAHVLASGGRHASDETDRQFLQLLSESAGERFGIEMAGGAPARVRCAIVDRDFLVDVFTNLFEVTTTESSVRQRLAAAGQRADETPEGTDFRAAVDRWLDLALC
jgi:hypothetical protein